ncbi:MAG: hypothetical protein ACP5HW_01330 [Candidatus Micrarchaeia archaeon]
MKREGKKEEKNSSKKNKKESEINERSKQKEEKASNKMEYVVVAAIIIIILAIAYVTFSNLLITHFSTFLGNFHSAPRVAVAVFYNNESQYISEYSCFTKLIESIAYTRNATTIDFFILNSTNCTYSSTGLGKPVQIITVSAKKCLSVARSEPSIFLNYSISNKTIVTPYHLYIYGNGAYMASCPVASELT